MRDLDRHLRNAASPSETASHEATPSSQSAPISRPSTSNILEAVGQAAASMAAMNARIQELEAKQFELAATNNQLRTKLSEVLQSQQSFDSRLRTETERAERAEEIAARHLSRAQILEGDLSAALGDLTRIAEAINGTLGSSTSPRRRL
jgi:chromosome segregation ATPase